MSESLSTMSVYGIILENWKKMQLEGYILRTVLTDSSRISYSAFPIYMVDVMLCSSLFKREM